MSRFCTNCGATLEDDKSETYLSVSFYEGTVTMDHTRELPDLESYFG